MTAAWRRRGPLVAVWAAFLLAHAAATALGWLWPNQPMGDTYLVYQPWTELALTGQEIMGVTADWVYPPLALAPMLLARCLVWFSSYSLAWAVLVTILDAVAFAILVRHGASRARLAAGWFWAVFVLALGPIGIFRLDAITVPIAAIGLLIAGSRPQVAGVLVGAATWIKVWPAALVVALVVALRRRVDVIIGGAVVSAVIAAVVALAGGAEHLFGFVFTQSERGLQVESVAATPFLFGTAGATVYYDREILTYQVAGPGVDAVAAAMGPLMAAAVLAICGLGIWRVRTGSPLVRVLPPLALALVVALIVCNKVGSPQFQSWLIAPLVAWIAWDRARAIGPAMLALVIAALTHLVYPVIYHLVLQADIVAIAALAARNVLVVLLGAWAVARLARTPTTL